MAELKEEAAPHYFGHRERLRQRFRQNGAETLPDYELMELILFRAIPRRDTKPLAKAIIAKFGGFAEAINATEERLTEVPGLGAAAVTEIRLVRAAAIRLMQGEVMKRPLLGSCDKVVNYCRAAMGFEMREQSASAIILVHNHPSGDPTPSRADIGMTKEIMEAGEKLDIAVHDHLIVGRDGHISLKSAGLV